MSDTQPTTQPPMRFRRMFAFGERPDSDAPETERPPLPLVLRFFGGQDVDAELEALTPDERRAFHAAVLKEFTAQERFRCQLYSAMVGVIQDLRGTSANVISEAEAPFLVHLEYIKGFNLGNYEASGRAAELVADALNRAVEGMMEP